jgi:hypothetical protein
VNGVFPRSKRGRIVCAPGAAPLPHCPQVRSANRAGYAPSEAPAAQDRQHSAELWLSSRAALTGLDRADGDETSRGVLDIGERHSTNFRGLTPKNMGEQLPLLTVRWPSAI